MMQKVSKKKGCTVVSTCVLLNFEPILDVPVCRNCDQMGDSNIVIGIPNTTSTRPTTL